MLGRFSPAAASWLFSSECQWISILKFLPPIISQREEVSKKHPQHGLSRAIILGWWHLLRKYLPPVGADLFAIVFCKHMDKVQSEIFYHSFFSLDSHFHPTSPTGFNHTRNSFSCLTAFRRLSYYIYLKPKYALKFSFRCLIYFGHKPGSVISSG